MVDLKAVVEAVSCVQSRAKEPTWGAVYPVKPDYVS
jgi:hypothetical protein